MTGNKKMLVEIPPELVHVKLRWVKVGVLSFLVPQGIVRLDIEKGCSGTHGWQVRPPVHRGGRSKFFRDVGERCVAGPIASLRRAVAYLAENPPGPHVRRYPNARPSVTTGIRGVRLVIQAKKHRKAREVYIEATGVEKGKSGKRFYCGTDDTVTHERLCQAIEKAVAFRESARQLLLERRARDMNAAIGRAQSGQV